MCESGIIDGLDNHLLLAGATSIAAVVIIGLAIYFLLVDKENKK